MRRPYERLSALFNVVAVMGVGMARFGLARFGMARLGAAWRGRRPSTRGAFGPVLACTRADYDLVGGHRAARRSVVEDVALAERFHAAGLPVTVVGGGPLVSFRMYPHGLRQLVEGWTKNIATGAAHAGLWRTALVVGWVCSLILSIQLALDPLASGGSWGPAAVAYAAFAGQLAVQLRQLGNFGWVAAAAYPVLVVFFVAVFARSLWFLGVRRRVAWRGRTIELAGRYGRAAGEMALAPTPSSAGEAGAEDR
jgi:4,4'-diaponeurosporenoate glycosyltransferase